jgi:hypothetical protein
MTVKRTDINGAEHILMDGGLALTTDQNITILFGNSVDYTIWVEVTQQSVLGNENKIIDEAEMDKMYVNYKEDDIYYGSSLKFVGDL